MAWSNCEVANFSSCQLGNNLLSAITNYNQTQRIHAFSTTVPNMDFNNEFDVRNVSNDQIIYEDSEISLKIYKSGSGLLSYGFKLTIDGTAITTSSGVDTRNGKYGTASYAFVIDEINHYAQFVVAISYHESSTYYTVDTSNMLNKGNALYNYIVSHPTIQPITANGGGATHIAKVTGQLSSLSNNLSDILMVSGGGGGGLIIGEDTYAGKDAGGISGGGNNSGNQSTGYAFGQGESGEGYSGGGGGLYGGYKTIQDRWANAVMPIPTGYCSNEEYWTNVPVNNGVSTLPAYLEENYIPTDVFDITESKWWWGNSQRGIYLDYYYNSSTSRYNIAIKFYLNGSVIYEIVEPKQFLMEEKSKYAIYLGYNDNTQKGTVFFLNRYIENESVTYYSCYFNGSYVANSADIYNFIKGE